MQHIKISYVLAAAVVFGVIAVFALRQNNLRMDQLRQQVYAADENNGDIESALENLRDFVTTHMNTSLSSGDSVYPPIQLKYTYARLVQAAGQKASDANNGVYRDAQKYCEKKIPTGFSGRYRLDCIEKYVEDHGGAPVSSIPDSLYKFDFVSPMWSPDVAGFSLLISVLAFVAAPVLALWRRIVKG